MSDYLVEPPKCGWKSWDALVKESGVRFSSKEFALGKILFAKSELPQEDPTMVIMDNGGCGATSVSWLLSGRFEWIIPVHPAIVLILASGMDWGAAEWKDMCFRHMMYEMAMSPFLLAHPDGRNFILLINRERDRRGLWGEFKDLSRGDHLPRCMHIRGYSPRYPRTGSHFFRKREDGLYGEYVTFEDEKKRKG